MAVTCKDSSHKDSFLSSIDGTQSLVTSSQRHGESRESPGCRSSDRLMDHWSGKNFRKPSPPTRLPPEPSSSHINKNALLTPPPTVRASSTPAESRLFTALWQGLMGIASHFLWPGQLPQKKTRGLTGSCETRFVECKQNCTDENSIEVRSWNEM